MKCSKDAFWKCLKQYISKTIILLTILFILLQILGGKEMMAMLFAQRVILGKTEFDKVPNKLKPQVADILINECGLPDLVPAEFGGTADKEK